MTTKPGWEAGGQKFDQDKPRMELLDAYALEELAKVLTFGAKKYAPNNWRKGISYGRLIAATLRHVFAFMRGEDVDPETGLDHMAHAMCCCMFLIWMRKNFNSQDDRYLGRALPGSRRCNSQSGEHTWTCDGGHEQYWTCGALASE